MIGRERELSELGAVAALRTVENERGERIHEEPAPLVVVYGGASTGKSMCVAQALRRHAELYTMVDCTGIYSAQEFYREILVQLYKNQSGFSRRAQAPAAHGSADTEGHLTSEDEQEVVEEARANAKPKHSDDDGAEHAPDNSDLEGEEEHDKGDSSDNSSDEEGDGDDEDEQPHVGRRSNVMKHTAIARAKRVRARQREQQQQKDAETRESHVTYEGYNSLNFLSFIKALGVFMDFAAKKASEDELNDQYPNTGYEEEEDGERQQHGQVTKRVVYLALDQVDKLLDRGFAPLLTCIFTVNEQLAYLNMFSGVQWDVSVLLITRAMSLEFDHLVSAFFPAYIPFSPYTSEQIADILVHQLRMQPVARIFRKWLLHLSSLVPGSQDDWLEFRRNVVHLLPDFKSYFSLVTATANSTGVPETPSKTAEKQLKKLMRATNDRVAVFQKTRRKHLFGYDKLQRSSGDPTDTISCTDLSRSCLLLIIAGYLASFNPQDTDTNFLSSSGGVRRKKRAKKTGQSSAAAEQISQLLIGPRIFTLQRLLAIYLNLRVEASADLTDQFIVNEAREDIFTHMATLVRMQFFQRTSPPNALDDIKFRCLADSRFVQETARYLRFPLESYLNTAT